MFDALVDTDVVSYIVKSDSRAALYQSHLSGKNLVISFMTLAELHRWALIRYWNERRRSKLSEYLGSHFTFYHSNALLCQKWADVIYQARRIGKPVQTSDAWIAATALLLNIPLVTHNRKDFEQIEGLTIISGG